MPFDISIAPVILLNCLIPFSKWNFKKKAGGEQRGYQASIYYMLD